MVPPKNKTILEMYSPQAIRDADEFVSSLEQIWRSLALHHFLTNRSCAVIGAFKFSQNS